MVKIITHQKITRPVPVFSGNPMVVWLTRFIELKIERGDRLKDVEQAVRQIIDAPHLDQLVAYWYAIGERMYNKEHDSDWQPANMSADPDRLYLTSSIGSTRAKQRRPR